MNGPEKRKQYIYIFFFFHFGNITWQTLMIFIIKGRQPKIAYVFDNLLEFFREVNLSRRMIGRNYRYTSSL